jgi:hypothetical protein
MNRAAVKDGRVGEGFDVLLAQLRPTKRESQRTRRAVKIVRRALQRRLGATITRIIPFGSIVKGTGIRGCSDVDMLFVVGPEAWHGTAASLSSTALLRRFRHAVARRFWSTRVRRDGQAIAVRFSSGVSFDIVPAILVGRYGVTNIYHIPDGAGGWITTAPTAELARFKRANRKSRGKLARTLQLLKHWRCCRAKAVPIRSYYVELLLTVTGLANGARRYSQVLARSFGLLARRQGQALRDPATRVPMTSMIESRGSADTAHAALLRARERALTAVKLERRGDIAGALRQWQLIFNDTFPVPEEDARPAAIAIGAPSAPATPLPTKRSTDSRPRATATPSAANAKTAALRAKQTPAKHTPVDILPTPSPDTERKPVRRLSRRSAMIKRRP